MNTFGVTKRRKRLRKRNASCSGKRSNKLRPITLRKLLELLNKTRYIAAFDFDGTLTTKDSLWEFLLFTHGWVKTCVGLALLTPAMMLMVMGVISNHRCKEIMLSYFFKGMKLSDFQRLGKEFAERGTEILNPDTCAKLKWHMSEGHEVYVVSASVYEWVQPTVAMLGVKNVLCTRLAVDADGRLTGKYDGRNCHGQEKVNRLLAAEPERDSYYLYAYGDSGGDKQMFELADEATKVHG